MRKAAALIRQQLGLDAYKMDPDEFAEAAAQAMWLKQYDQRMMEAAMTNVMNRILGGN